MFAVSLGIIAGLLQALGYVFYFTLTLRRELRPNASTWFMFAYGTALLTLLEFNREANWALLILPITCTVLGVLVAAICWYRGTLKWPVERGDRIAFILDVILTVFYLTAWFLKKHGSLTSAQVEIAVLMFLVASNMTTFTSFGPLLRQAWSSPASERCEPWLIWALAYVVLAVSTCLTVGLWNELMLYPLINAPLHGSVAFLACRKKRQRYQTF